MVETDRQGLVAGFVGQTAIKTAEKIDEYLGQMLSDEQEIMFCRRDRDSAREDMQRMLGNLKKRVSGQTIKGALYFSCLGRGRSLFGPDSAELGMIRDELGDIPLTGFYCNGEIAHDQLYGYTGVLTVFL